MLTFVKSLTFNVLFKIQSNIFNKKNILIHNWIRGQNEIIRCTKMKDTVMIHFSVSSIEEYFIGI